MEASKQPAEKSETPKQEKKGSKPEEDDTDEAFYSVILHGQIAFGKAPTPSQVKHLIDKGYKTFVNLLVVDKANYEAPNIIYFPIDEDKGPKKDMRELMKQLNDLLRKGEPIYVHCKNGRGRTGVVVSCLLALYLDIDATIAIDILNFSHRRGHGTGRRWQKFIIPSHRIQRRFIYKFLGEDDESE